MKIVTSTEQTEQTTAAMGEAEHLFDQARERLFAVLMELENGQSEQVKSVGTLATELRKAWFTLQDERKRVYEFGKKEAGIVHNYALDFDDAREQVQRLLDRLCPQSGTGRVPRLP